jgi:hypothetical protein
MPLRALVNGNSITSVTISPLAWDRLKRDVHTGAARVILPCCQGRGFLRRSVLHLQHFVHAPGSACEQRNYDSGNYLEILSIIHEAAEKSGLPFEIESQVAGMPIPALLRLPGKNGRLAILGYEKRYTASQILAIHRKLAAQRVRGCWLLVRSVYDGLTSEMAQLQDQPIFRIEKVREGWTTCLRGGMPLSIFLYHLFQGHFHFTEHAVSKRAENLNLILFRLQCPRCGTPSAMYTLAGDHISRCDLNLGNAENDRFRLEVVAAARNIAIKNDLPLGHISIFEKSDPPRGAVYCPACRKNLILAGQQELPRRTPTIIRTEKFVWKNPIRFSYPHWCFSVARRFCS